MTTRSPAAVLLLRTRSTVSRGCVSARLTPSGSEPEVVAAAAAVSDGAYTLFVADFADTTTAWDAYEALKSVEDGRTLEIDGVIVVTKGADGALEVLKATDHSTKHGQAEED